jgi:hypothetical protein
MTDRERTRARWYGLAWLVLLIGGITAFARRDEQLAAYPRQMAAYRTARDAYAANEQKARALIDRAIRDASRARGQSAMNGPDSLDAALQREFSAVRRQSAPPGGPLWPAQYDADYLDPSLAVSFTIHFVADSSANLRYSYFTLTRTAPAPAPPFSAMELCETVGRITIFLAAFTWFGLLIVAIVSREWWWEWSSWSGLFGTLALAGLFYVRRPPALDVPITAVILVPAAFTLGLRVLGRKRNPLQHLKPGPIGRCKACGYNMTGNTSGICPECGTHTGRITPEQIAAFIRSSARLGRIAHSNEKAVTRRTLSRP